MKYSDPLERATKPRTPGDTWDDDRFRDARERDLRERTAGVGSAVVAALTCLLLATLLTSGKIVEIAERQELGTTRDRQLDVAQGVDRVANFLSLNRPYDFVRDVRGIGSDPAARIDTVDEVIADLDVDAVVDPATGEGSGPEPGAPDAVTSTTTTTTLPAALRTVTAEAPLKVYVGGDSQAEYLAQAITTESPHPLDVQGQHEISSSLARPDYFNWPARLRDVAEQQGPEAVVLFIGANDDQDMADADGTLLVQGTPEWRTEWKRRLTISFDLLEAADRHVFWVTQPPMRSADLNEGVRVINELAAEVIAARDFVTAVDIWPLFGGDAGFSSQVTGPDGAETRARIDDGVHLTRAAQSWVADIVFAEMAEVWDFEP